MPLISFIQGIYVTVRDWYRNWNPYGKMTEEEKRDNQTFSM